MRREQLRQPGFAVIGKLNAYRQRGRGSIEVAESAARP